MSSLAVNEVFHNAGLPDPPLPTMSAFDFMPGGYSMSTSHIGSRSEMLQMLQLASEKGVKGFIPLLMFGVR